MDWKNYEKEIFEYFEKTYPNAIVKQNQKLLGRYSKTDRQIDILIEDYVAGRRIRLIVDGKFFSKKIDVKEVETFISMVEDVQASQGILITSQGYSEAAINRAYYGPTEIELDILNFDELKELQGFLGIPYSGKHGAILPSPFGWIIDIKRREGTLANLYQRGLTYEEALKQKEWIYVNIFSFDDRIKSLQDVIEFQEKIAREHFPSATFEYNETIKRKDGAKTSLRKILIDTYPAQEYTGFIEFDGFCFFCVLFTPEELRVKNIRKLEYLIERVLPVKVNEDSIIDSRLREAEFHLKKTADKVERAEILITQGNLLKKQKKYDQAERKYNLSIEILSSSYGAIKGKIDLYLIQKKGLEEIKPITDDFFELGPTNPTVCTDLLDLFAKYDRIHDLISLMESKISDYDDNHEAQGNINYHLGLLFSALEMDEKAQKYFDLAHKNFRKSVEPTHYVFELIEENLRRIKLSKTKNKRH